jgi:signal transduction protein with GAF and PtsI domain
MDTTQIGSLHELASFLSGSRELSGPLNDLATHTAQATHAASCSVMLLSEADEDAHVLKLWVSSEKDLPKEAWLPNRRRDESIAWHTVEAGHAIKVDDIEHSPFKLLARRNGRCGGSFMCAPVKIGKHSIGVLNLAGRSAAPPFDEGDLSVAEIAATLIAQLVQVERLQTLLRSRVAQIAMARAGTEASTSVITGRADLARVAKILARSFYKDLASAGFAPGQIIEAASEVIGQVSSDISRHKKRMDRSQSGESDKH